MKNEIIDKKNIDICISVLNELIENSDKLTELSEEQYKNIMKNSGKLSRPDKFEIIKRKKAFKKKNKLKKKEQDKKVRAQTGIRKARENEVFSAPKQITDKTNQKTKIIGNLNSSRNCYVCKKEFTDVHFFYDTMCFDCAEYNYKKRFQTTDLTGKIAVITGSRLKIGYHITLMLLRAGATVIATTRFPVDSALRYSKENDYDKWKSRLQIFGLDLRHIPSVEIFCEFVKQKYKRLDILINNAAQTVRRPPGFYSHLIKNEIKPFTELPLNAQELLQEYKICKNEMVDINKKMLDVNSDLPVSWNAKNKGIGITASAKLSQIPYSYDNTKIEKQYFPEGKLDADLQQIDLRNTNSWRLKLGEINTAEMIELQLVNSIAPFVLCNKFVELMKKDFTDQKFIVNVSAMEGKFLRFKKGERHPHTNMAKAALNMLTHTSADELAENGIYMNAVDTGWVTDEDPVKLSEYKEKYHDFQPPLDIVDGAARVCDPIFNGIITGKPVFGKFLKDYFPIDW